MNGRRLAISAATLFAYGLFSGAVLWAATDLAGATAMIWSALVLTVVGLPLAGVLARWTMTPAPGRPAPVAAARSRPVLAVPASRHRHHEIVLTGQPVSVSAHVLLGWDGDANAVTLNVADATPEWVEDLLQALVEARRTAGQAVRP